MTQRKLFRTDVPMLFCPSRHNFGDTELNFRGGSWQQMQNFCTLSPTLLQIGKKHSDMGWEYHLSSLTCGIA